MPSGSDRIGHTVAAGSGQGPAIWMAHVSSLAASSRAALWLLLGAALGVAGYVTLTG